MKVSAVSWNDGTELADIKGAMRARPFEDMTLGILAIYGKPAIRIAPEI